MKRPPALALSTLNDQNDCSLTSTIILKVDPSWTRLTRLRSSPAFPACIWAVNSVQRDSLAVLRTQPRPPFSIKRLRERNASRTFRQLRRRLIRALSYLPDLLFRSRLESSVAGLSTQNRSVIWLWPCYAFIQDTGFAGGWR